MPNPHGAKKKGNKEGRKRYNASNTETAIATSSGTEIRVIKLDCDRHFVYKPNEIIEKRYQIISALAEGCFSCVLKVKDNKKNAHRALKITRNSKKSRMNALYEVNVLKHINDRDPENKESIVKMIDWFEYYGYMCIILEEMGFSLRYALRRKHFRLRDYQIVEISHQICKAVGFLHSLGLAHLGINPRHVLFVNPELRTDTKKLEVQSTQIKIVDLAWASFRWETCCRIQIQEYCNDPAYEAPEVIVHKSMKSFADIWAVGCLLYEIKFKVSLFQISEDVDRVLELHRQVIGDFPVSMLEALQDLEVPTPMELTRNMENHISNYCQPMINHRGCCQVATTANCDPIFNLVFKMLKYVPKERIGLYEALNHPYFANCRL